MSTRLAVNAISRDITGTRKGRNLVDSRPEFHQLARAQPNPVFHGPHQPVLGSDTGGSLPLVEFPAPADDRSVYPWLVGLAHRRGMCLDCGYLCDGNCLRGSKAMAGLGALFESSEEWKPSI